MPLKLDPICQAAIDFAKTALKDGAPLDIGLLLDALYHHARLAPHYPDLEPFLQAPVAVRIDAPGKVQLAPDVRPIFQQFAQRDEPLQAGELFSTLLDSAPGRAALQARGAPQSFLDRFQLQPSPARAEWRASAGRLSAIQALSSYGRMLTDTEPPHGRVTEREATIKALASSAWNQRRAKRPSRS